MSKPTDQQQHTTVVSSRPGNTDSIRHMLREQKKHCASLHANPLFQEFWHRSKPPQDARPPVIDDLEAEGQARLFDVIRSAAETREAGCAGVWASFGQPYACLGEPKQLDTSAAALLPHLNRDDIEAAAAGPKQQQQQQQPQRRGGMRVSRTGSIGTSPGAAAAAAAALGLAAAEEGRSGAASGAAAGAGPGSLSSSSGPQAADAAKLLHHKTVMHFNTVDRLEASFPQAAVRQAEKRQKAARVKGRRFFDREGAQTDLADAAASYGHHDLPSKPLPGAQLLQQHQTAAAAVAAHTAARDGPAARPRRAAAHDAGAAAAGDGRHAFFITQQAAAGTVPAGSAAAAASARPSAAGAAPDNGTSAGGTAAGPAAAAARRHSVSLCPETDGCAQASRASAHAAAAAGAELTTQGHGHSMQQPFGAVPAPAFGPITAPTMQPLGSSSNSGNIGSSTAPNPVIAWHNEFVGVRQAGYAALQETLWQRSTDRAAARGEPGAAAVFSRGLLQQLARSGGRFQSGWIPGTTPESPFAFATSQQQQQEQAAGAAAQAAEAAAAAAATPKLKPAEVELLELFYGSLCSLVERQRLSDPMSLALVHKVKALLEGGTFLQPAMLQGCLDCIGDLASSCGLRKHNRFLLPLLAFVRKCVGVGQAEFDAMVAAAGIESVVFEPAAAPEAPAAPAGPFLEFPASLQQQQQGLLLLQQQEEHEQQQQQRQQLAVVPEDGEVAAAAAAGDAAVAAAAGAGGLQHALQRCSLSSAGAAAVPPGAPPLRLERSGSAATAAGHSPRPATFRSSGGGSCSSSSGGGGSSGGRAREGSSSGANTSRMRGASNAGARPVFEGPSVPGINAAAIAAAAEITAAIQAAPASQRALAAVAAGTAGSGSITVKVPGVAGPVELLPALPQASPAAAAAAAGNENAGGVEGVLGADGGEGFEGGGDGGEDVLPDLGCGEDGEPLSRRLRQQEGLAAWGTLSVSAAPGAAAGGGGRRGSSSGGADVAAGGADWAREKPGAEAD